MLVLIYVKRGGSRLMLAAQRKERKKIEGIGYGFSFIMRGVGCNKEGAEFNCHLPYVWLV